MLLRLAISVLALVPAVLADTLTLKNGQTVQGTYLGGDARQIRVAVGERVESYDLAQVSGITFGSPAAARTAASETAAAPVPSSRSAATEERTILRPERPIVGGASKQADTRKVSEIPENTQIVIRMIDDIDSGRDRTGQEFKASLDEPVMVNGEVAIPRNADVVVKLVDDKEASRISGRSELTLDIRSVQVDGRMVDVTTQVVTQQGESRTKRTAGGAGGGAALGAIIGAIAGGGKGAAIGAVAGAGAGTAAAAMTKGTSIKVPAETRLTFTLQYPVKL